jgi:hypothetical protein
LTEELKLKADGHSRSGSVGDLGVELAEDIIGWCGLEMESGMAAALWFISSVVVCGGESTLSMMDFCSEKGEI